MGRICKPVLLLFLFLLFLIPVSSAVSAQTMTPQQWEQLKNDKDFSYKNDREQTVKPQKSVAGPLQHFFQSFFRFFSDGFGTLLIWLIVFFVATCVIYRLMLSSDSILFHRNKKQVVTPGETAPEDFTTTDWDQLMQQALNNNDTRLAIRCGYMRLLQLLQQNRLISYRQDKTNHEYNSELIQTPYRQSFRQLSRLYEYTWYGKYPVSSASLNEYVSLLNTIKRELGR